MGEASGKKVLIVEDDTDAAEMIRIVLEDVGYEVVHTADAKAGMDKVHEARPDVILLDVMMPTGTEGFHFVWELRKDSDTTCSKTPIIILTAIHKMTNLRFYPDQDDPVYEPYEYLPVEAFLDKPASPDELLGTIRMVLQGTRPTAGKYGVSKQ